jgi:hypothetical protein
MNLLLVWFKEEAINILRGPVAVRAQNMEEAAGKFFAWFSSTYEATGRNTPDSVQIKPFDGLVYVD